MQEILTNPMGLSTEYLWNNYVAVYIINDREAFCDYTNLNLSHIENMRYVNDFFFEEVLFRDKLDTWNKRHLRQSGITSGTVWVSYESLTFDELINL